MIYLTHLLAGFAIGSLSLTWMRYYAIYVAITLGAIKELGDWGDLNPSTTSSWIDFTWTCAGASFAWYLTKFVKSFEDY